MFLATLVVLALALAACGGSPPLPSATPAVATPTATEILSLASGRVADTRTVHYELSITGDTYLDPTNSIKLLDANGDLQRPDRVYSSFRADVLGRVITLQLITVGSESWTTDILTGEWVASPVEFAYDPSVLFDVNNGIGPVMDSVTDVRRLADEELNGRPAYRIEAKVAEETIGPLTSHLLTGPVVTVDLWIDRETNDLLRAELSQPPVGEDEPITWTLDLSRHGEDVSIEPPV